MEPVGNPYNPLKILETPLNPVDPNPYNPQPLDPKPSTLHPVCIWFAVTQNPKPPKPLQPLKPR